jgi:hypothetical protein
MKNQIKKLEKLDPCDDALVWVKEQEGRQQAWDDCERGDWMLWLLGKLCGDDRRELVLTACDCARLSLKYVERGGERPLRAIETVERWVNGDGTIEEVRSAAHAADAAADAASAAYAAAYAAYAADAAFKQCADIVRKHYPKATKL